MFGKVAEILGISTSPGLISCESESYETVVRNVACHGYQIDPESATDGCSVISFRNTWFPRYHGTMFCDDGVWKFRAVKF
jgi:hypothetical protein